MRQQGLLFESRVDRLFADWIETEDGQIVEAEVVRHALALRANGWRRWGIAAIWEVIRYDFALALKGEAGAWKLNNDFRAPLARRVMQREPALSGFFETRAQRGKAA